MRTDIELLWPCGNCAHQRLNHLEGYRDYGCLNIDCPCKQYEPREVTRVGTEMNLEGRHRAVVDVAKYFTYDHLPEHLQPISKACHDLAAEMLTLLEDCPELTRGLSRLLEAKDWFVRAKV